MIQLHPDFLFLKMSSGDLIPCSAEVATVELLGDAISMCDPDMVRSAASAVLHYFKHDCGKEAVSIDEFAEALVRVLRKFGLDVSMPDAEVELATPGQPGSKALFIPSEASAPGKVFEADLAAMAADCDTGFELAFFQKLRDEVKVQLSRQSRVLRFHGLRGCVKQLVGARRWCPRCQELNDQIVAYLRQCMQEATPGQECSLMVRSGAAANTAEVEAS